MTQLNKTIFHDRHEQLGAKMVDFSGWHMPLHYKSGIVQEHLATRKRAGLFDVSHMGRFVFSGDISLEFLQHVLSNNAAALEVGQSQYTLIPNGREGVIDDAYLYRFREGEYVLVVNAGNLEADWAYLRSAASKFAQIDSRDLFEQVGMVDLSLEMAMVSLQGPMAKEILSSIVDSGELPGPQKNTVSIVQLCGSEILVAKTGYTGEPIGFELFVKHADALKVWDALAERGAEPIGLGARDTLRLEAGFPLYGHELGFDPDGREIPAFASRLSRYAVSFTPRKGEFIGKHPLEQQFQAFLRIVDRDYSMVHSLARMIMPVAMLDKAVARAGSRVFRKGKPIGHVTSGTTVPYWKSEGKSIASYFTDEHGMRSICLALIDSRLSEGDEIEIEIRGKMARAVIVPFHLRSDAPPHARPIVHGHLPQQTAARPTENIADSVNLLLEKTVANSLWRQRECINLIPSEQTHSAMTRLVSIMDPSGRYAEHKALPAFNDEEVFYYQGTDFIAEVERLLANELRVYLDCTEVESRLVSGQMANTVVFSALMDFLNRADRKSEPRRIRSVLNHHIINGGHLSAQPMGALRDFVARRPSTERPAVINFPILPDDPYRVDLAACKDIIEQYKPELIILGKSMTLYKEPVSEMRATVAELGLNSVVMFDMAHVLGLVGPHFQDPFREGADLVTGSTHKTFFGTQRGIVASNVFEQDMLFPLWETIERRAFPGSVSNHHLGTMLGLLMAAYEMNAFRHEYQPQVIANAKAFATALKHCGLDVAGDPSISHTETHQVILNVGYAKAPRMARTMEENNIVLNYQAAPHEEGFTASGSLRMGVQEMTRFGMKEEDFEELAGMMADLILRQKDVKQEVATFRKRFQEMHYCFAGAEFDDLMQKLHGLI